MQVGSWCSLARTETILSELNNSPAIAPEKKAVDDHLLVIYDPRNTGKEVIQKFMSSYHSEVAAA
jgi:hypothetical protein